MAQKIFRMDIQGLADLLFLEGTHCPVSIDNVTVSEDGKELVMMISSDVIPEDAERIAMTRYKMLEPCENEPYRPMFRYTALRALRDGAFTVIAGYDYDTNSLITLPERRTRRFERTDIKMQSVESSSDD